jgi:hypothetical protein
MCVADSMIPAEEKEEAMLRVDVGCQADVIVPKELIHRKRKRNNRLEKERIVDGLTWKDVRKYECDSDLDERDCVAQPAMPWKFEVKECRMDKGEVLEYENFGHCMAWEEEIVQADQEPVKHRQKKRKRKRVCDRRGRIQRRRRSHREAR